MKKDSLSGHSIHLIVAYFLFLQYFGKPLKNFLAIFHYGLATLESRPSTAGENSPLTPFCKGGDWVDLKVIFYVMLFSFNLLKQHNFRYLT
jgi:hypothetical protein